jgi:hypothetical protein
MALGAGSDALIVLASVVIGGLYYWKQLPPTISPQTEYAGIRLGMGPDEVLSVNGSPPAVYGEAEKKASGAGFSQLSKQGIWKKERSYRTTGYGAMSKVRTT